VNRKPVTDTLIIAKHFGREHKNVIQSLEKLFVQVDDRQFNALNFQPVDYLDAKGEKRKKWVMTEAGFAALATGFTGAKAAKIRAKIIGVFASKMESDTKLLDEVFKAIREFEVPDDVPDMHVYAIKNTVTGAIKLGISRDPQARIRQLQTGNDCRLELIATRPAVNRFADERALHVKHADYRISGEWFDLPTLEVSA
jgi:Rha family phage regulatory protein